MQYEVVSQQRQKKIEALNCQYWDVVPLKDQTESKILYEDLKATARNHNGA